MNNCVAYGTRKHAVIQIRTGHKCYLSCAVLYIVRQSRVEWSPPCCGSKNEKNKHRNPEIAYPPFASFTQEMKP